MAKIKIVTDSTSDLPKNIIDELNIEVVPLALFADGVEYRDGLDITPEEFYKIMESSDSIPTSSCVPPALYTEVYEKAYSEGYTDLILTSINSKGSSTYQGAVMTRDMFFSNINISQNRLVNKNVKTTIVSVF